MHSIQNYLEELKEAILIHEHPYKITFQGLTGNYAVLGNIPFDLGTLRVTLQIKMTTMPVCHTLKLDLLSIEQIQNLTHTLAEKEEVNHLMLEADILKLAELLQQDREYKLTSQYQEASLPPLTPSVEKTAIRFLKSKGLLTTLNTKLGELGIVGEEDNRLLLFLIAISYKTAYPLHGIVQSESGTGKSHLINTLASCVPPTDKISLTRITSKSFYYYKSKQLTNKLILLQDLNGLDDEALYVLRELQSLGEITSSTTRKDNFGNLTSQVNTVTAHFSSLSTTTNKVYPDNQSRSILVRIDETEQQTREIVNSQNQTFAGKSYKEVEETRQLLTSVIRTLQPKKVINPYAELVTLPLDAKILRRLNKHFQQFILLITWLHQYQRKQDEAGNLLTEPADLLVGVELMVNVLMYQLENLEPKTNSFFEELKKQMKDKPTFNQKELRETLGYSKSHTGRYLRQLVKVGKLSIVSNQKQGYTYKLSEPTKNYKEKLKQNIYEQLKKLEG